MWFVMYGVCEYVVFRIHVVLYMVIQELGVMQSKRYEMNFSCNFKHFSISFIFPYTFSKFRVLPIFYKTRKKKQISFTHRD